MTLPHLLELPAAIRDLRIVFFVRNPWNLNNQIQLSSIDRDGTTVTVVYLQKQSDWIKFSILPSG